MLATTTLHWGSLTAWEKGVFVYLGGVLWGLPPVAWGFPCPPAAFVGMMGVFKKAGWSPLWVFVPVLNTCVMLSVARRSWWWAAALFAPVLSVGAALFLLPLGALVELGGLTIGVLAFVGFVILGSVDVCRQFRQNGWVQFLAIFFPGVLLPVLGFASPRYRTRVFDSPGLDPVARRATAVYGVRHSASHGGRRYEAPPDPLQHWRPPPALPALDLGSRHLRVDHGANDGPRPTARADWYGDPTGRHELRYFDGTRWTEHVADGGVQGSDALGTLQPG